MSASLKAQIKSKFPLIVRLSKVFADPLRMKILAECNMREMSPKLFYEEFGGGSLPRVARAFDVLVEYDWLYLTKTKSGESGVEGSSISIERRNRPCSTKRSGRSCPMG